MQRQMQKRKDAIVILSASTSSPWSEPGTARPLHAPCSPVGTVPGGRCFRPPGRCQAPANTGDAQRGARREDFADRCIPETGECVERKKDLVLPEKKPEPMFRYVRDFNRRNVAATRRVFHAHAPPSFSGPCHVVGPQSAIDGHLDSGFNPEPGFSALAMHVDKHPFFFKREEENPTERDNTGFCTTATRPTGRSRSLSDGPRASGARRNGPAPVAALRRRNRPVPGHLPRRG